MTSACEKPQGTRPFRREKLANRELVLLDDELRGFGLRMKPSGRTSYFVQYRNRFGRSRRHTFAKGEEMPSEKARKRAKALLGGVAAGQDPAEEKKERLGTITVRELAKEYLEKHLRPRRKPTTIHEYTRALERIILPRIGSRKVTDLSRRFLHDLHASLARTPTTANRIITLLSAMIGYAERRDLVPPGTNLCSAVERFPEQRRERFLTSAELTRLGEVLRTAGTNPRRRCQWTPILTQLADAYFYAPHRSLAGRRTRARSCVLG
jgi:hypothetical protein